MSLAEKPLEKPQILAHGNTLPFVLVATLFFLWGISSNLNDVLIRRFMESFEMNRLQAGLIQSACQSAAGSPRGNALRPNTARSRWLRIQCPKPSRGTARIRYVSTRLPLHAVSQRTTWRLGFPARVDPDNFRAFTL
jgi:hypothetical protein